MDAVIVAAVEYGRVDRSTNRLMGRIYDAAHRHYPSTGHIFNSWDDRPLMDTQRSLRSAAPDRGESWTS